jgi:preprotein translocase subunit SecG
VALPTLAGGERLSDREFSKEKPMEAIASYVLVPILWITSSFLIILVLIQRGRGGGLAGALGGMGGQSAFGAKAGDTFTRITIVVASTWIVICVLLFFMYSHMPGRYSSGSSGVSSTPTSGEKPAPSDGE